MLLRLSAWCFRNPRKTVAAWIVTLIAVFAAAGVTGPSFYAELDAPDSDSRNGFDVIEEHFGGFGGGFSGSIVFRSESGVDDPEVRQAMEAMFREVDSHEGVSVTSPYLATIPIPETPSRGTPHMPGRPQVSVDGQVAFARVDLAPELDFNETSRLGGEIVRIAPDLPGLRVEIGGEALSEFEPPQSEFIGLAFAVVVLILAFGSVMAMGLPIAIAVAGVGVGLALAVILSNVLSIPEFAATIGAMIGIGVGIDYALFIVTRYRDGLAEEGGVEPSAYLAFDTAGRAVIFAGLTVVISLLGMLLMGLPFITGLAVSAALTVAATMIASVTLLPALMGFVRDRIEVTRWRGLVAAGLVAVALLGLGLGFRPLLLGVPLAGVVLLAGFVVRPLRGIVPRRAHVPMQQTLAWRWSRLVQSHPWIALIAGAALLLAMAAPVRSLQLGFADDGNFPEETTTRRAYDLLAEGFGPGFNGPLIVTAEVQDEQDRAAVGPLLAALAAADGVVSVNGPLPSDFANPERSPAYMVQVYAATAPQDPETAEAGGSTARRRAPRGRRRHDAGRERHRLRGAGRRLHQLPGGTHPGVLRGSARGLVHPADGRVPLGAGAAQSRGHEPAIDRRCLRRGGAGVPAGLAWLVDRRRCRAHRAVHPDDAVRDRLRALHGLRGVPALPRARGVRPQRRREGVGGGRARVDGAGHHRGRGDHGGRLRQFRVRGQPRHQDVRPRARRRRAARRDGGAAAAGAGGYGADGGAQLVGASLARPPAAPPDDRSRPALRSEERRPWPAHC